MSWHLDLIAVTKERAKTAVQDELALQPIGLVGAPDRVGALGQAIACAIDLLPELEQQMGIEIHSEGGLGQHNGRVLIEISTIRMAK